MKYALISGQRQEAQRKLAGECPACGGPMVSKCGEINIWHWAHRGKRACDHWWENETEWHRAWKGQFPADWQEVVQHSSSGEKHIADVKTDQGWIIEFQHSRLEPEERRARNNFYEKLVWVVNGVRRKKDRSQFFDAFKKGIPVEASERDRTVSLADCALLQEWFNDRAPVFFDFGEESRLWLLLPKGHLVGWERVAEVSRAAFLENYRDGAAQANDITKIVQAHSQSALLPRRRPILEPSQKSLLATIDRLRAN